MTDENRHINMPDTQHLELMKELTKLPAGNPELLLMVNVSELAKFIAAKEREARLDENVHHKLNSQAAFHVIPEPTDEQRRIHEGLTMKFDTRIAALRGEAPASGEQQNG
jgi:hypothetical protein